jgi:hypothetical protein
LLSCIFFDSLVSLMLFLKFSSDMILLSTSPEVD